MAINKSDFDRIVNRRGTNCGRWDTMDIKYKKENMIHLGVADMDFASPKGIIDGLRNVVDHGVFGYTDLSSCFYDSIIAWMKKHSCADVLKEEIVFCPRINVASSICVDTFTNKGDEVIINTPAYAPLYNAIIKNHRTVLESPLKLEGDHYKLDFDHLESIVTKQTKMLILCNPHNPVGRVWDENELLKLGEFCEKYNLILFSDEIHSDIMAEGVTFTSTLSLPDYITNRLILATSLTKTFNVPGVIVSYMIIKNQIIREEVRTAIDRIGMHNPNIFSLTAVENGYTKCDEWYKSMLEYINDNETFTREYFSKHMPDFKIFPREGTYLLWIDYKEIGCSENELEHWFVEKANVSVYMGTVFGEDGRGYFRMNIASSRLLLKEAYDRMTAVYSQLIQQ